MARKVGRPRGTNWEDGQQWRRAIDKMKKATDALAAAANTAWQFDKSKEHQRRVEFVHQGETYSVALVGPRLHIRDAEGDLLATPLYAPEPELDFQGLLPPLMYPTFAMPVAEDDDGEDDDW